MLFLLLVLCFCCCYCCCSSDRLWGSFIPVMFVCGCACMRMCVRACTFFQSCCVCVSVCRVPPIAWLWTGVFAHSLGVCSVQRATFESCGVKVIHHGLKRASQRLLPCLKNVIKKKKGVTVQSLLSRSSFPISCKPFPELWRRWKSEPRWKVERADREGWLWPIFSPSFGWRILNCGRVSFQ